MSRYSKLIEKKREPVKNRKIEVNCTKAKLLEFEIYENGRLWHKFHMLSIGSCVKPCATTYSLMWLNLGNDEIHSLQTIPELTNKSCNIHL